MQWAYFDNAATTRTDPAVVDAMLPYFTCHFGNPSSGHDYGRAAAVAVTEARRAVGELVGARDESEIVFTAGATEANTTALLQALGRGDRNEVVVSAVEHPSVLSALADLERRYGLIVHRIGVDGDGRLDCDAYRRALGQRTALVSLMWANNETGVVFPVGELAAMAHEVGALFHSDAVQAAGKIPIDVDTAEIDLLSLSAHKFHGPKGIGALYVRKGTVFRALLRGGRQERARRAGTENVPAIVGFGRAAQLAQRFLSEDGGRMVALREALERSILAAIPACNVLGGKNRRLPGTAAIAFDNADGEEIVHRLNRVGIAVSSGAACASGNIEPSHVVRAMRVPQTAVHGVVRFSLSRETLAVEVDRLCNVLPGVVAGARRETLCPTTLHDLPAGTR